MKMKRITTLLALLIGSSTYASQFTVEDLQTLNDGEPVTAEAYVMGYRDAVTANYIVMASALGVFDELIAAYNQCHEQSVFDTRVIMVRLVIDEPSDDLFTNWYTRYLSAECPELDAVLFNRDGSDT